jgi:polysaccharide pyruvyl transferase WcaK-like protein
MTQEILLITRIRTLNKGNQALSAAWLAMLERAFPTSPMRVLERRPRHLLQYTLRDVSRSRDPVATFDRLASELAKLAPGPELVGPVSGRVRILLDETTTPPQRFVRVRQRLNLRGRLATAGLYADEYKRRLSACQRAQLVVVNPAGEFFPREPQAAFYHLLDAAVARKLGRPTAIVNHTMDITDPTLRELIPPLYRTLDLVGFRDEKSVKAFRDMGGDNRNVLVTPDLALTGDCASSSARRTAMVAVAVNVPEARAGKYLTQWFAVFRGLRSAGLNVVLVSNELPADLPFYTQVMARFPEIALEGAGLDHDSYCRLLGTFDVVVTSRMHTGILAMVGGAPVVPVEGSSFKITGLFQELGFEKPVIRPGEGAWVREVLERTNELRQQRDVAVRETRARLGVVRDRIISALVPRLQAAARRYA